jgi:hypothetical protein
MQMAQHNGYNAFWGGEGTMLLSAPKNPLCSDVRERF